MKEWALTSGLQERILPLNEAAPDGSGEFVLYWAHHALRTHDNPALDTAASLAIQLDLPLLVYQGLGGRHRYNADRHHQFILEAARDFSDQLTAVGQRLLFHLPQDPLQPGPLGDLVGRSAVTVSELYPVPPFRKWYRGHVERNPSRPWLLVDASCILPMPLSEKAPTRAFRFRQQHREEIEHRLKSGWPERTEWPRTFEDDPGFRPFDFVRPLPEAIAECRIDHSIPAVSDTPGGSQPGYRRWEDFRDQGLDSYHLLRNDAARPEGASRMSSYLHYGCVSPFRIARDALARGGEGAEKFLDELLVWRELSHHFCNRSETLETLEALPAWARDSLQAHEADPRVSTFDWETLSRGKTGQPLWDLAQRSLLRRGELHNNVRMTWGKAFLPWAQRSSRALKLMVDLNHRYALDGNDPNSYGGLLWCMGQFDRAFPPGPVFGKVRQRSVERHAQRLDMDRFAHSVSAVPAARRLRVVVVGAGLAGLTAARILDDQGHNVVVVDKGRKPGGRMSTRRSDDACFDHGAQYFTARDPRFLRHVLAWRERGLVDTWSARIAIVDAIRVGQDEGSTERYLAVPGMSAICAELARELPDCRSSWHVSQVRREAGQWTLTSEEGRQLTADAVVIAIPAPQAMALFQDSTVTGSLAGIEMQPCWAVMAVLDRPLLRDHDAAFVNHGPLSWVAGQASRPGRPGMESWVLHAGPEWSAEHLDDDPGEVRDRLLSAALELPIAQAAQLEFAVAHRWRYALARKPLDKGVIWFEEQRLALAGDWCHGSRVEGAFLSGAAAAGRVMASAAPGSR
ncbi:MAG: FAD-dependent oxidoreductase [Xanthomonadales bacterium]|nr:FAD-dependent oxidoreductase [Xanthomonadales bacterium]